MNRSTQPTSIEEEVVRRKDLEFIISTHSKEAARQTVAELESLTGYNFADVRQRNEFQTKIAFIKLFNEQEFRENMAWVTTLRTGTKWAGWRVFTTLFGMFLVTTGIVLWEGTKAALVKIFHP